MQHAPVHDPMPVGVLDEQIREVTTKISEVERQQEEVEAALEGGKSYRWMKTEVQWHGRCLHRACLFK